MRLFNFDGLSLSEADPFIRLRNFDDLITVRPKPRGVATWTLISQLFEVTNEGQKTYALK